MPVPTASIGKTYEPCRYAVGREKIREYAHATGETDPLHLDLQAARAAGHADLVAPPMFVVVYAAQALAAGLFDPELEIDFAMLVHGGQAFEWERLVIAGDEIETTLSVKDISERMGNRFYVFQTESVNQDGATTAVGTWTQIVRGA